MLCCLQVSTKISDNEFSNGWRHSCKGTRTRESLCILPSPVKGRTGYCGVLLDGEPAPRDPTKKKSPLLSTTICCMKVLIGWEVLTLKSLLAYTGNHVESEALTLETCSLHKHHWLQLVSQLSLLLPSSSSLLAPPPPTHRSDGMRWETSCCSTANSFN